MVKIETVWDRTTEFLGDNIGVLLPIVVLAIFVPASISGSLADVQETAGFGLKLGLGLLGIAFSLLSLWAQLAIAALAIDPALGSRAAQVATARLLPAIGVFLAVLAGAMLLAIPILALMSAAGFDFAAMAAGERVTPTITPGYGFAIFAVTLVAILILLFVGARLATLTAVIVAERRGLGAIPRAFALTRGLTWKLVGVVILYAVVAIVAVLAAQTVFGSVLRIVSGEPARGTITIAGVITSVVVAAVSSGFTTLAAAFCAKLYAAVVRHNETTLAPAASA
ncbi:hypothetical protein M9980_01630 [Sphingomonas donggukensis]|uniref:Glycerophosphoryl diester phosphodiesterase membrane domain-containing protein n=1 Tax=Sphingomonas donggukensis TaxID=2949093 RepID=A0ABY4TU79_9SPHN|nr:hypothetical protein [Sphingomonas donggukensis]URW75959.1 hypothetical protein M9980_01630 [Sphingomonas donggukensis]